MGLGFRKDEDAKGKEKKFYEQPTRIIARPLRADGDSRTGKRGTRHLLNNTKNKAIPCPREKQEAWHEIRGGKNSDSELRIEGRTKSMLNQQSSRGSERKRDRDQHLV